MSSLVNLMVSLVVDPAAMSWLQPNLVLSRFIASNLVIQDHFFFGVNLDLFPCLGTFHPLVLPTSPSPLMQPWVSSWPRSAAGLGKQVRMPSGKRQRQRLKGPISTMELLWVGWRGTTGWCPPKRRKRVMMNWIRKFRTGSVYVYLCYVCSMTGPLTYRLLSLLPL